MPKLPTLVRASGPPSTRTAWLPATTAAEAPAAVATAAASAAKPLIVVIALASPLSTSNAGTLASVAAIATAQESSQLGFSWHENHYMHVCPFE